MYSFSLLCLWSINAYLGTYSDSNHDPTAWEACFYPLSFHRLLFLLHHPFEWHERFKSRQRASFMNGRPGPFHALCTRKINQKNTLACFLIEPTGKWKCRIFRFFFHGSRNSMEYFRLKIPLPFAVRSKKRTRTQCVVFVVCFKKVKTCLWFMNGDSGATLVFTRFLMLFFWGRTVCQIKV